MGTTVVIILVVYLLAMLAIGFVGTKHSSNMKDFLTAGKQGTLLLVTGSYLGAHIGNGVVVGGAEYGVTYGIGGIWYGIGAALSYFLFAAFMAKKVYRGNYVTISDLLADRYGDKATSILMAALNASAMIAIMAGQIMAGQRLFEYMGLNGVIGAIATTVIVIVYSALSGLWGVLMTDVIQTVVIFITTILAIIFVAAQGGFALMAANLPAESFRPIPFSADTFVMIMVPAALFGLISAVGFQRTVASKTEKIACRAPLLGGLIIIPFVFLPVLLGMYGKALWPDAAANTIIFQVMTEAMPVWLAGLMIAAICAAVMSTCDGGLLSITANVVSDIYHKHINPNASEKRLGVMSKVTTVLAGALALVISLQFTSIISLLSMAYTLITAGALVMVVGGIYWKRATNKGAVASFIAGILFIFLDKMGVFTPPFASIFPLLPSLIAFVAVSLLTQRGKGADNPT